MPESGIDEGVHFKKAVAINLNEHIAFRQFANIERNILSVRSLMVD